MINPHLKNIAIVLLVIQLIHAVFLTVLWTSMELLMWYLGWSDIMRIPFAVMQLALVGLFMYYCHVKGYKAVLYGLIVSVAIIGYMVLQALTGKTFVRNYNTIIVLGHALTILLSNARSNGWLKTYAIVLLASLLLERINPNIGLVTPFLPPIIFIAMLRAEETAKYQPDRDVLDDGAISSSEDGEP